MSLFHLDFPHVFPYTCTYMCTKLIVLIQDGNSALMMAAREGHTAVVVELIKGGVNLDLQNVVCH